jgi:hypothetical protein
MAGILDRGESNADLLLGVLPPGHAASIRELFQV